MGSEMCIRDRYKAIGKLSAHQFEKHEELEKFVNEILSLEQAKGAKALAVVIHIIDEMSLATLSPDYQNREELLELRDLMSDSPKEALGDKTVSIETHAWKLFPYPGAADGNEFATAVAVSRKHEKVLKSFREIGEGVNLPIRTAALCAPLCALASQPLFSAVKDTGVITVVLYKKFTLLGFYNKSFELMLMRYMPHSNGANAPANIGPAVMATCTALELESPLIQLLPMCRQDVDQAIAALQSSMMGSEIVLVDSTEIMKGNNIPEDVPLEMLVSTQHFDVEHYALAGNETFGSYQTEKWHSQDFLSASREELEMYPGEQDMKFLKIGNGLKVLAAILLVSFIAYTGYNTWSKTKDPAWGYKTGKTSATVGALTKQMQEYEQWESLLKHRSKAWVSMELISRMAPNDGSVIFNNVAHKVTLQAGKKNAKKLGLKKVWSITGYMNEKGLNYLSNLSTREGVAELFQEVAVATGNSAYRTDTGKRDLTISLKQQTNSNAGNVGPKTPGTTLKYSFNLVITQTFESDDEMAIAVVKKAKNNKK